MIMKWSAIGFWAVLTEVLAHFLSLTWGFGMLVVAFIWVAGMLRATSVKAQSTEARVSALVPQVKSVSTTANSASSAASAAQSTANGAQSDASSALSQLNGAAFPVSRATGLTAAPTSYNQTWGNSVVSFCTQVNNQLQAAGVFV